MNEFMTGIRGKINMIKFVRRLSQKIGLVDAKVIVELWQQTYGLDTSEFDGYVVDNYPALLKLVQLVSLFINDELEIENYKVIKPRVVIGPNELRNMID